MYICVCVYIYIYIYKLKFILLYLCDYQCKINVTIAESNGKYETWTQKKRCNLSKRTKLVLSPSETQDLIVSLVRASDWNSVVSYLTQANFL